MKNGTKIIMRSVLFALLYVLMYKYFGIELAACAGIGQILAELSILTEGKRDE